MGNTGAVKWSSNMKTKARIDEKAKVWYGEFQIPLTSITDKAVTSLAQELGSAAVSVAEVQERLLPHLLALFEAEVLPA